MFEKSVHDTINLRLNSRLTQKPPLLECGDANPLNDFQAVLESFQDLVDVPWLPFIGYTAGLVQLQSSATNYLGLDANFSLRATLTASGTSLPESLVRPSVSFAILPGRLLGVDGGSAVVLECCDGFVGRLSIQQAFFPSTPFIVPPGGLTKPINLELHLPEQIVYAPVPEPTSLLLLGPALAAAALRRRRAKRIARSELQ